MRKIVIAAISHSPTGEKASKPIMTSRISPTKFAPSPTDPAGQPDNDPDSEVYGEDEGYERPTSA
jgi:hypothetical protein